MPSKKKKVLDIAALKKERLDTVERLRFHQIAPKEFEIDKRDQDYLFKLRSAWSIMSENVVIAEQVKLIASALMVTERHARNIIEDAKLLFADIFKAAEECDKAFLTEYYLRLAAKAEQGGFFDSAKACLDSIAKMHGHFDKELPIRPEDLNIPTIILTADPKALTDSQIEDAEVVD